VPGSWSVDGRLAKCGNGVKHYLAKNESIKKFLTSIPHFANVSAMKTSIEIEFDVIRARRGLTRYEAANEMGISRDHLRAVLRKKTPAGAKTSDALFAWSEGQIDLRQQ
jgi:predicted DNA-binding protein (UPF0251 family)